MADPFTRIKFEKVFNVETVITLFYMELSKNFVYSGESHDFWEMVYVDTGEVICTADKTNFILKSGEIIFHKPNEFHNLKGNDIVPSNISIITFECNSRAMSRFDEKIFKLSQKDKRFLSMLFKEGLACYKMTDETNPLIQSMEKRKDAPFGGSQITKNLLEIFLIELCRNESVIPKAERKEYILDETDISPNMKGILDYVNSKIYGKLRISDIAEATNQSESSVKKIFAEYIKGGIISYYHYLKIKEARYLIRENRYNMSQISEMLCFDNPQCFTKCFKSVTNMTPTQYKESVFRSYMT